MASTLTPRLAILGVALPLALTACAPGATPPGGSVTAVPSATPPASAAPTSSSPRYLPGSPAARVDVVTGLDHPWSLVFLPDGSFLFTERGSKTLKRAYPGTQRSPEPVGEVPDAVPGGEGGVLGLALHGTGKDTALFVYYTAASDNRVQRFTWDGSRLSPGKVVLSGLPKGQYHNGGRIAVGPDAKLYVAAGDAGKKDLAQDKASPAGKIHRIELDGSVPADNPFPGSSVWTWGHRNVQGLAWDKAGRMFASELGQSNVDEVNLIEKGKNYGWPVVEGAGGTAKGYVDPVVSWSPTKECSPSGATIAQETLYVACLAGQRVYRIPLTDGRPGTAEKWITDLGRVRLVAAGPDGRLYALTDNGQQKDRIVALPTS